jgi:hypothetical protein
VRDAGVVIEPDVLAVGDARRAAAGGLAVRSLMFAVGFAAVLWLFKEVPFLYAAEPWRDDPYDAFVSFAIAAIPLVGAAALVRLASCRRSEPLPVRRLWELIALARTATTIALVVIAVEWASVLLRANRAAWQPTTVAVLVILGGCSAAAVWVVIGLRNGAARVPRPATAEPDLLSDAVRLALRESVVLGPLASRARRMIVWCDRQTVARVRRHPLLAAAAVASIMGIGFAIPKIVFERYRPSLVAFVFVVSACSFFALVVVVAARLGLVAQHSAHPRTATVTVTAMSAAIPAAVTFRNVLWWTVGTTEARPG